MLCYVFDKIILLGLYESIWLNLFQEMLLLLAIHSCVHVHIHSLIIAA